MPLTKKGIKILEDFRRRYGAIKGEGIFHAYINKFPKRTKSWHK